MLRAVFRSMYWVASKLRTSAAILALCWEVSKRVIGPTPETPSTRLDQTVSVSWPMGVTKPIPVTATRTPLLVLIVQELKRRGLRSHLRGARKLMAVLGHGVQRVLGSLGRRDSGGDP